MLACTTQEYLSLGTYWSNFNIGSGPQKAESCNPQVMKHFESLFVSSSMGMAKRRTDSYYYSIHL